MASFSDNDIQMAMWKYFASKVPNSQVLFTNFQQDLVLASAFTIASPLLSKNCGNPETITLFLRANATCAITVYLSIDGADWYQAAQVNLSPGSLENVTTIPGANFVKVTTDTDLTTASVRLSVNF